MTSITQDSTGENRDEILKQMLPIVIFKKHPIAILQVSCNIEGVEKRRV